MSTNPASSSTLPNPSRLVGTASPWGVPAPHQGSPASTKSRRRRPGTHNQFWLNISKVAAQHTCHKTLRRPQSSGIRCAASGEEPSTSGREEESLLIVGPGVLGGLVGHLYHSQHPGANVVGQTNTSNHHDRLRKLGIKPRLKQDAGSSKFPNVLFSAPPSGSSDYVAEVEKAIGLWDRSSTFVFTSSSGALDTSNVSVITEDTPVHRIGKSERVDKLVKAEQAVLQAGGCVLRLVGLYHLNRGAHTFFLKQGSVSRAGNHIVNLIHYEDAAALIMKILERSRETEPLKSQSFLGTDSTPITFKDMMEAVTESGRFEGHVQFTGPDEDQAAPGSSNEQTKKALGGWEPKYKSFKDFMLSGVHDFYASEQS